MTRGMISRRTLVAAAAAPFVLPRASSAQAVGSAYGFWTASGQEVIGDVNLSLFSASDGGLHVAALTYTPTQWSNDQIVHGSGEEEASHVDILFDFYGLRPTGETPDPILGASDHVRYAGAEVVMDDHPVFIARCFNIEKRWEVGRPITVTATISGYVPSVDYPWVSVQMAPCWYSMVVVPEGSGPIPNQVFGRVTDGVDKRYTRGSVGEPLQLFDKTGHSGFLFP